MNFKINFRDRSLYKAASDFGQGWHFGETRPAKMIANGIGKWPPTALAKRRGDKNQPLPAIGTKAMIKTKPPT